MPHLGIRKLTSSFQPVENAIRNTYETRQLSGWMNLEGANDAENEDGEWVSYLIYQGDEI